MTIKNGRKLELEKMVKEAMIQCRLLGLNVSIATDLVKKAMKQKGAQLSKEELQYCSGYQTLLLSSTAAPETTNLGGGIDDVSKIGKTPNVEGVPVGEAEVVEAEIVEETPYDVKKSFTFNADKAQNKVNFELKLPTEEQLDNMVTNSDRYVKGLVTIGSKLIKSSLNNATKDYLRDEYEKTSISYKNTGKLSDHEEREIKAFSNLANSVFSIFFK